MDIDEVVHETDYDKIRILLKQMPKPINLVSLPVTEYWGGSEKVRVDVDQEQTEKDEEVFERNHYSNLAEELPEREVANIGRDLVKSFEDDKSSRKNWEDQYSKGLRMLGVVVEDRQDPFPGASGVHHPLLAEAATQFQARAIAEMFRSIVGC